MAIDGTHFEMRRPKTEGNDFFNRKGFYSLHFICLINPDMKFRALTYGHGSNHDSRVLRISKISERKEQLPENTFIVEDRAFRAFSKIEIPIETETISSQSNSA